MSDRAAFVAAIEAEPDCDLPRLMWADWLDDHGEPQRAELIRVQCELTRHPSPKLRGRERAALNALGRVWPTDLQHYLPFTHAISYASLRSLFRRGCLTGLRVGGRGFAEAVGPFIGREPLIDLVLMISLSDGLSRQTPACPHLSRVAWIDGYEERLGGLLRSPHFTGLRCLFCCRARDLDTLRTAPAGANLSHLEFGPLTRSGSVYDVPVDPLTVVQRVAAEPRFVSLRWLSFGIHIHPGTLSEAAVRALIDSPHLSPELDLWLSRADRPRRGSPLAKALKARFPGPPPAS